MMKASVPNVHHSRVKVHPKAMRKPLGRGCSHKAASDTWHPHGALVRFRFDLRVYFVAKIQLSEEIAKQIPSKNLIIAWF